MRTVVHDSLQDVTACARQEAGRGLAHEIYAKFIDKAVVVGSNDRSDFDDQVWVFFVDENSAISKN